MSPEIERQLKKIIKRAARVYLTDPQQAVTYIRDSVSKLKMTNADRLELLRRFKSG